MAAENISAAQRRAIPARDFAGPHRSFPVRNAHEAKAAITLAGHATNPDEVRAKVKALAAEKGLSGALPKTATASHGMGRMRVGQ